MSESRGPELLADILYAAGIFALLLLLARHCIALLAFVFFHLLLFLFREIAACEVFHHLQHGLDVLVGVVSHLFFMSCLLF